MTSASRCFQPGEGPSPLRNLREVSLEALVSMCSFDKVWKGTLKTHSLLVTSLSCKITNGGKSTITSRDTFLAQSLDTRHYAETLRNVNVKCMPIRKI